MSFWSMLKLGYVGVCHKMSAKHLHRYIAKYEGRHNIRNLGIEHQMAMAIQGAEGKRLTYAELVG